MSRGARAILATAAAVAAAAGLAGCGGAAVGSATSSTSSSTSGPVVVPSSSTATPSGTPTGTPVVAAPSGDAADAPPATPTPTTPLRPGDDGPKVRALQQRLNELGYWNGEVDGTYGELTQQAVMALQKAAGLDRDGVAGKDTLAALDEGVLPPLGSGPADRVEIDLERQLIQVVEDGERVVVLNTSTGSGELFTSQGYTRSAVTPTGSYRVNRVYDGPHVGPLGSLWRPRYFNQGIAVHGAPYIPGQPASHGCARVSNGAMDMIWAEDLMPMDRTVVVR